MESELHGRSPAAARSTVVCTERKELSSAGSRHTPVGSKEPNNHLTSCNRFSTSSRSCQCASSDQKEASSRVQNGASYGLKWISCASSRIALQKGASPLLLFKIMWTMAFCKRCDTLVLLASFRSVTSTCELRMRAASVWMECAEIARRPVRHQRKLRQTTSDLRSSP